jgi:AcrR family transcriptional regulator
MSTTIPARRRRLRPEERREEILAAAMELVSVAGFNGVSLDSFAEACGMTKAGLLHHFPSKEELLTAVLERRDELDMATIILGQMEPTTDARTSREVLTRLVQRNIRQKQLVQLYTVLSAEALDPSHPAHGYFQDRLVTARTTLERRLFAWHPQPSIVAIQLLAFLDGLQLNWLRDPTIDFLAHWETFADGLYEAGN